MNDLKIKKKNKKLSNFKVLGNHKSNINHLDKLRDGRLISCSDDNCLNIYNKDSFELQLSIKEHDEWVTSFTQLNDGKIITCSGDSTMNIIKLIKDDKYQIEQKLKGHSGIVYKIIEAKENELISISYDNSMKIWKSNNKNNKFECILTIIFQNICSSCNILKLNKNEYITLSRADKLAKFWNLNNYTNITILNNIIIAWPLKTMCLLEADLLCIGGTQSTGFYLIKISSHQIIKNILGPNIIYSINKCLDNLILCSIQDNNMNNKIIKYKYEEYNLKKISETNSNNNEIYSCVELDNRIIASGGTGNNIKLWLD